MNLMKLSIGCGVATFILIMVATFVSRPDPAIAGAFCFGFAGFIAILASMDEK